MALLVLASCASSEPTPEPAPRPRPPRHTWDDDEIQKLDFPEATTKDPAPEPKKPSPRRPILKLTFSVVEVISWEDVKIRGDVRGSPARGLVSLTGWLKTAKATNRSEQRVEQGRETVIAIEEPLRELVGGYTELLVGTLDSNEKGEVDLALTPHSVGDEAPLANATRVHVGPGEAVVLGGHRKVEGDPPEKKDQLVLLEAAVSR
jgi:hypothetical protein